jgi:hypothetical protein
MVPSLSWRIPLFYEIQETPGNFSENMDTPYSAPDFTVFTVIGTPREVSGYIHGLRYPSLLVLLRVSSGNSCQWVTYLDQQLCRVFEKHLEVPLLPVGRASLNSLEKPVTSLLFWMGRFFEDAGYPLFEEGKIIGTEEDASAVMIAIPSLPSFHKVTEAILLRFLEIFNIACSGDDLKPSLDAIASLKEEHLRNASLFSGMYFFLKAAFEKGIPWFHLELDKYVFGSGSLLRMFDRTFTDRTSVIGAHLAGFPALGNALLYKAGIPLPARKMAPTLDAALAAAEDLGFPVVLTHTPSNGISEVTDVLLTMDELRGGYLSFSGKTDRIFVEHYFKGRIYRFTVFQGKPLRIVELATGIAMGEGAGASSVLHGGVHPDNVALVLRSISLMRLDLADIDLKIPDIGKSWMESGALICNLKVQPDLGGKDASGLYDRILESLVQGDGRIPVALVAGSAPEWHFANDVASILSGHGLVTAISDHEGVAIGARKVHEPTCPYCAGQMMLLEKKADAMLLCVNDTALFSTGLPFGRFDLLVLAGSYFTPLSETNAEEMIPQLHTLFDFLIPSCDGEIISVSKNDQEQFELFAALPDRVRKRVVDRSEAVREVARAMLEAGRKHREKTCREFGSP